MDILQIVLDTIKILQANEAALSAGASAVTLGAAAVRVFEKGRELITYHITDAESEQVQVPALGGPLGASPDGKPFKQDVAIVVDINRRLLPDVAAYLQEQQIDADLFFVTNNLTYAFKSKALDVNDPEEWKEVVQEFNAVMEQLKVHVKRRRIHIFMSVPLPIAFGMGAVWGTVDVATVYHYQGSEQEPSTYYPVMKISRALRFGDGV